MNNEAQFGLRFAIKNAKQVQKALDTINMHMKRIGKMSEQTGKRIDDLTKRIEDAGRKGKRTLSDGEKHANKMSKSLDKVVTKWLSIGGAITLVSRLIRRAFARIDELVGLNRMAQSAGVLDKKIYSLGRHLKELYGGDASSAAGAYTSVGDIIGAARSGRGISQDVVEAASRYGIALNGGMLTEDQLMTNIARAMQVQRKKGNMYGVRDIASAFGIDEAMMLHLSEKGANWDRGLPAANIEEAKQAALKAKELQEKLDRMADKLVDDAIPLLERGMQAIINLVEWLNKKYNANISTTVVPKDKQGLVGGKTVTIEGGLAGSIKKVSVDGGERKDMEQVLSRRMSLYNKWTGKEITDPVEIKKELAKREGRSFITDPFAKYAIWLQAQEWVNEYNKDLEKYGGVFGALNNIDRMIQDVPEFTAKTADVNGKIVLVLENNTGNKASVSSADFGTASIGFQTIGE